MGYSEIQNKVIDQLDRSANIRCIEDFEAQRDGNSPEETVVEITTYDGDEYYFRYNVWPDGETELHRFKLEKSSLIQYDERFSMFREKETAGDEPFDVAVENEIKKERENKKMINFNTLYKEAYLDAFTDYVKENRDDLTEYAEETSREKIIEHINDNIDFEDVAHNIIEEMIDYYIEYDAESDGEDLEQVICDYIFE